MAANPVVAVVHQDGRSARMTSARLAALGPDSGWSIVDPTRVVAPTDSQNIAAVLRDVGDDPVKAQAAIEVEKAGKNRPTLISKLEAIAAGPHEKE